MDSPRSDLGARGEPACQPGTEHRRAQLHLVPSTDEFGAPFVQGLLEIRVRLAEHVVAVRISTTATVCAWASAETEAAGFVLAR